MTSANKIISELSTKKRDLFKSFFLKYKYNFDFEKLKKFKKFKTIIIIGMGGSILGSKAIYDFLRFKIKKPPELLSDGFFKITAVFFLITKNF